MKICIAVVVASFLASIAMIAPATAQKTRPAWKRQRYGAERDNWVVRT